MGIVVTWSSDADRTDTIGDSHYSRILDPLLASLLPEWKVLNLGRSTDRVIGPATYGSVLPMKAHRLVSMLPIRDTYSGWAVPGSHLHRTLLETRALRSVINRFRPSLLLAIDGVGHVFETARELGVPTVEVLHARGYSQVFPSWENAPHSSLPDFVFAFDQMSFDTFSSFLGSSERVFLIQDCARDFFETLLGPVSRVEAEVEDPRLRVLFTLVWGEDFSDRPDLDFSPGFFVPAIIEELIRETSSTHFWNFRLHPVQRVGRDRSSRDAREYVMKMADLHENVSWYSSTNGILAEVIEETDMHITVGSMSVYDAALAGVPSLFFYPEAEPGRTRERMFSDLRETGHLTWLPLDRARVRDWIYSAGPLPPFRTPEGIPPAKAIQLVLGGT